MTPRALVVDAVAGGALAVAVRLGAAPLAGVIINEHWLSAADTRAHVEWLARRFDLIGHDELVPRLSRRGARPFCLFTFDDGKRSNATETAPALERLGVPAVFYVTTGFVGGAEPLWFDRLAALARALGPRLPAALAPSILKQLPLVEIEALVDDACRAHGVAVDAADEHVAPMSWDDVRALRRRGFVIGAHGVRHAVLTREPADVAAAEVRGSLARVARELGEPCPSFAFPNGNYTAALAQLAQSSGAATVMTTEPTWVARDAAPWRLPRVQLFPGFSRARVELKLAAAATGRLLVNPDGTGRRYWTAAATARGDAAVSPRYAGTSDRHSGTAS